MKIISSAEQMQRISQEWRASGAEVAMVPTMGALHAGHLSLIQAAQKKADVVVVTLFVNPTQFGENEDFSSYPRCFDEDCEKCRLAGVDVLFVPTAGDMYADDASTWVYEEVLSDGLCGQSRPGHFQGVCTVVLKLCHIVAPHYAIFGEKDVQQVRVIERMTRDLFLPVSIVRSPTIREHDGLAMSSRNRYLSASERHIAPLIFHALSEAKALFVAGQQSANELIAQVERIVEKEPAITIDYLQVVDEKRLQSVSQIIEPSILMGAFLIQDVRLIDHVSLI